MKHVHTYESFLNEGNYWEVNADTKKIFPVKNDKEAERLLSGKRVSVYKATSDFDAIDVYGKKQTIRRGTVLDVYIIINSGNIHMHNMYVDKNGKRYFPSDYRGESQLDIFENNTTMLG